MKNLIIYSIVIIIIHAIYKGTVEHMSGNLERRYSTKQSQIFDLNKKVTFFYKECIVYPYVSMNENKKGYILLNTHLTEILNYVEEANFGHL